MPPGELETHLVRVASEELEICDAVVRSASGKHVRVAESAKDSVATSAAARDGDALAIDHALLNEVLDARDRVLDIDDAPVLVQTLAVLPAVASATSIVDVGVREATRSHKADLVVQAACGTRRRSSCVVRQLAGDDARQDKMDVPWQRTISGGFSPSGAAYLLFLGL